MVGQGQIKWKIIWTKLVRCLSSFKTLKWNKPWCVNRKTIRIQWDLNNKHLNMGNIWITNFHFFAIQMPGNSLVFKPSVTQPTSQTTYDLNNELLVHKSWYFKNSYLIIIVQMFRIMLDLPRSSICVKDLLKHINPL